MLSTNNIHSLNVPKVGLLVLPPGVCKSALLTGHFSCYVASLVYMYFSFHYCPTIFYPSLDLNPALLEIYLYIQKLWGSRPRDSNSAVLQSRRLAQIHILGNAVHFHHRWCSRPWFQVGLVFVIFNIIIIPSTVLSLSLNAQRPRGHHRPEPLTNTPPSCPVPQQDWHTPRQLCAATTTYQGSI
ncbi:hypothetical protein BD289DRAFT_46511 [Coniella lustricola]|uniref:Uncharacterized protein n=1 Tax=Coniella lustricola TaxID=2025994 RepID=A0A2T3AID3_9PEZI|nr:hypothetical protein BD289DRAFT_46511 [Coniella lustricola]